MSDPLVRFRAPPWLLVWAGPNMKSASSKMTDRLGLFLFARDLNELPEGVREEQFAIDVRKRLVHLLEDLLGDVNERVTHARLGGSREFAGDQERVLHERIFVAEDVFEQVGLPALVKVRDVDGVEKPGRERVQVEHCQAFRIFEMNGESAVDATERGLLRRLVFGLVDDSESV